MQELVQLLTAQCANNALAFLESASGQLKRATQALPEGFPPGPGKDLALDMASNSLFCMEELKAGYGGIAGFKLASQPVVLVSSPRAAKQIFTENITFVKAGTAFFPDSSLTGNGLLVSDGDVWLRQRRLSNPAFRRAAIDTYANAMIKLTHEMIESKWQRSGIHDIYADMNELTLQIVVAALFGTSTGSSSMSEIVSAISTAFKFFSERATSMLIVPEWVPTPSNIQFNAAVASLDRVVYKMIADRRMQLKSSVDSHSKDLLTRLLQAKDDDGSSMDDTSLRDELMTLLVAGQETSSIVLSWCLLMLAAHKQIQEKLFQETMNILDDRDPSAADELPYTDAVIWETMRLLPPAYVVGRCACRDTNLCGWNIPSGTTTLVSLYLLQRDPLYWHRATEFVPNRWKLCSAVGNDSYWPFGGGQRNCIGAGFAMLELRVVLSMLIRKYEFSLPKGSILPQPRALITLRPQSPSRIWLTRREGNIRPTQRNIPPRA